jgi:hypothetical protein
VVTREPATRRAPFRPSSSRHAVTAGLVLALGLWALPRSGRPQPAPTATPSASASSATAVSADAAEGTTPEDDARLGQQVAGWVTVGLGGAGFVAGIVTGALALQTESVLDQGCVAGQCPPAEHANVDAFYALRTASTVSFAVSGAVLCAGFAVLLTVPPEERAAGGDTPPASGARSQPRHAPRGAHVALGVGPTALSLGGAW